MNDFSSRRQFLSRAALTGAAFAAGRTWMPAHAAEQAPEVRPFQEPAIISGSPRERGRAYGRQFADATRWFLDREIYAPFGGSDKKKDELFRYADACWKFVRADCPEIADEMEGMAEGTGLRLEEHVLLTLHEELYHRGGLPPISHCTAVAVGAPATKNGETLVGQTWDWMTTVAGVSSVLEWKRTAGPSLLAYSYPGLWVGAGMNSKGLALCWTSADLGKPGGPRVGLPSYVLLPWLLYQDDLDAVRSIAERNRHAGWFTFVMADGEGRLLNVEGSPEGIEVQESQGRLVRVMFGTRKMTNTPAGRDVALHPRCVKMDELLRRAGRPIDSTVLEGLFLDRNGGIYQGPNTIDVMLFDTTRRIARLTRGPDYGIDWKEYKFTE